MFIISHLWSRPTGPVLSGHTSPPPSATTDPSSSRPWQGTSSQSQNSYLDIAVWYWFVNSSKMLSIQTHCSGLAFTHWPSDVCTQLFPPVWTHWSFFTGTHWPLTWSTNTRVNTNTTTRPFRFIMGAEYSRLNTSQCWTQEAGALMRKGSANRDLRILHLHFFFHSSKIKFWWFLQLIFPHPIICHLSDDHPLHIRLKRRHYFEQFDFVNMWQHVGVGTAAYQELIAQ